MVSLMKFQRIPGPPETGVQLKSLVTLGRVPHALLLAGPPGSCQLWHAMALSAALQCESPSEGEACGFCGACHKTHQGIHPDIHMYFPFVRQEKERSRMADYTEEFRRISLKKPYMDSEDWFAAMNAERKSANITAETCRDILGQLSLMRYEGKYKVIVIWLPEYLDKEGNILLKQLEEPEENTVIILASENQEAILPTILSRCQILRTYPVPEEQITAYLQAEGTSPDDSAEVAWLSGGSLPAALRMAEEGEQLSGQLFLDWLRTCYQGRPGDMADRSDRFEALSRNEQKRFFRYGGHFLQQALHALYLDAPQLRLSASEAAAVRKMKPILDVDLVAGISHKLDEAALAIERNANPKVLFLACSIGIHRLWRGKK